MRPWRRGSATDRSNGSGCTGAGRISRCYLNPLTIAGGFYRLKRAGSTETTAPAPKLWTHAVLRSRRVRPGGPRVRIRFPPAVSHATIAAYGADIRVSDEPPDLPPVATEEMGSANGHGRRTEEIPWGSGAV